MSARPKAARDAEVCAMRVAGKTLQVIADFHGISRERVRQILDREWRAEVRAKWSAVLKAMDRPDWRVKT